jgi:hypothetical protein
MKNCVPNNGALSSHGALVLPTILRALWNCHSHDTTPNSRPSSHLGRRDGLLSPGANRRCRIRPVVFVKDSDTAFAPLLKSGCKPLLLPWFTGNDLVSLGS